MSDDNSKAWRWNHSRRVRVVVAMVLVGLCSVIANSKYQQAAVSELEQRGAPVVVAPMREEPVAKARGEHPTTVAQRRPKKKLTPGECRPDFEIESSTVVLFETGKGTIEILLRPDLAPHGAYHLVSLIRSGYYLRGNVPMFSINDYTVMFGSSEITEEFRVSREFPNDENNRKDDNPCPKGKAWDLGTVAMMGGPHVMIVKRPNDGMGKNENDAPAGYVTAGLDVVNSFYR